MKGGSVPVDNLWIGLWITLATLLLAYLPAYAQEDVVEVAALLPPPAAAAPMVLASAEGVEIRQIAIEGLNLLPESTVLTALTIREGDILVGNYTAKLNDVGKALYDSGWFRSVPELALDDYEGGALLKVTVQENPVYTGTRLTGNTLFSSERLIQELEGTAGQDGARIGAKLTRGQVINVNQLYAGIEGMLKVYHDAGYIAAKVADFSFILAGPDEGIVEIKLSEGLVEEVIISGLNNTKESVVRSQITHIRPGGVLTLGAVQRDLQQIYNTGLFDAVTPEWQPSLKEGYTKVVINVEEAPTGQAGFGLGYSTINGLQGQVSYNEKNLFGTGKEIGAVVVFSRNKPGFELTYSDPYLTDNSFWNVGVFLLHHRQQRNPGLPYESEINIDTQGASFGYGQHMSDYDTWQASFAVMDYDYEIIKGDPFRGYTPAERARLATEGQTRKLGLSYAHDTRDNIFNTTEGYLGRATGEIAGFGGDYNFNKWTFEGREFFPVGPGALGFRQKVGMASGNVPIYEEYHLGGVSTVRGISEDRLTGTHSLLSNVEYRLPISDMFGAVGFLDYGAAGSSFSDLESATGAGVGVRIRLPFLGASSAVRLDYGWELSGGRLEQIEGINTYRREQNFHFFLGEMF